ncbi:L-glyceraldehyde 3-phosphate reductase [Pseudoruegeria aquimaris]|uniref:L-glyceraldehyde 3-phosphate reductase n=1 Tax=Pseudoruegeria aquimaris TaxID=393663 RepID=A0A1Y5SPG9_9RHOB|nr:aldo/keto reductase [Pseudoruegeria aquimaris]SLN45210.1 L-glyceraldehyde 3-phosphate reductase [Pseudoruegeria aquimaris]
MTAHSLTPPDGSALSPLCFGAMQFGSAADAKASEEMFEACRAKGVNFFDTAHGYTEGRSETLLGRFAAKERDRLLIASKIGYTGGCDRATLLAQFDVSRKRLGLDTVDLLYLHRFDAGTPLEETFEVMAGLQAEGRIRYIGVSNYAAWQVMKAQGIAARLGTRIDIIQPMYNLVKRQAEVELLPMCASESIACAPYSPLGGGLLTGKYASGGSGRLTVDERYSERYAPKWMHEAAAGLAALAAESGHSPITLAIAWCARHPGVTAPIISARSAEQLAPSLAAAEFHLDDALHAALSALTPAPPPATDRLEEA